MARQLNTARGRYELNAEPAELDEMVEAAERADMTLAQWMRTRLLKCARDERRAAELEFARERSAARPKRSTRAAR